MKIEIFTLCDAATDQMGKLNILGSFDTIHAKGVPVNHPACAIALRFRLQNIENGTHTLRFAITDADGKAVIPPFEGKMDLKLPDDCFSVARNFILNLQGIQFKNFGEHSIDFAMDGRHEASIPLFVNKMPERN